MVFFYEDSLLEMANKGYESYIKSDAWHKKRQETFDKYARGSNKIRLCELCSSSRNLHIHHLSYKHFTNENLNELVILCEKCHLKLVHNSDDIDKQIINYWVEKIRDSKNKFGRRSLPKGMIFTAPLARGERYLRHRFNSQNFYLIRGKTYRIDNSGQPRLLKDLESRR